MLHHVIPSSHVHMTTSLPLLQWTRGSSPRCWTAGCIRRWCRLRRPPSTGPSPKSAASARTAPRACTSAAWRATRARPSSGAACRTRRTSTSAARTTAAATSPSRRGSAASTAGGCRALPMAPRERRRGRGEERGRKGRGWKLDREKEEIKGDEGWQGKGRDGLRSGGRLLYLFGLLWCPRTSRSTVREPHFNVTYHASQSVPPRLTLRLLLGCNVFPYWLAAYNLLNFINGWRNRYHSWENNITKASALLESNHALVFSERNIYHCRRAMISEPTPTEGRWNFTALVLAVSVSQCVIMGCFHAQRQKVPLPKIT